MVDAFDLQEKRILITGASKGLGRVCTEEFAKDGARLLLAARSTDKLQEIKENLPAPEKHMTFAGDLNDPKVIRELVEQARVFGEIDVILHSMGGGLGMRDPLLTWEEFDTLSKTNIRSAAEINRLLMPGMKERKTGNIVHVGSITSREAIGSVGYNTIKAGVAAYVRTLGREVADMGIIVTGILPGAFLAPDNSWERMKQTKPEIIEKFIEERMPRKKFGDAKEIVPLLKFLCSRHATMMTGCCVPIDGGEGITYVGE